MRGKKAFELSMTFLVTLILIIVIFTGSIYFTKKFFATAEEMRGEISRQTEADIEALLYQEGTLIALPIFKKTVRRGRQTTFGVGIRNILERTENFYVLVSFSKGFNPDEEIITETDTTFINEKWLLYSPGPYSIPNNKLEMIPILTLGNMNMAEGVTTEKGTYSFNVCVIAGTIPTGFDCGNPRPLPPAIYGGKIYKIYLEVV